MEGAEKSNWVLLITGEDLLIVSCEVSARHESKQRLERNMFQIQHAESRRVGAVCGNVSKSICLLCLLLCTKNFGMSKCRLLALFSQWYIGRVVTKAGEMLKMGDSWMIE